MDKNILLIRFSSRESGNCAKILQYLRDYYSQSNVSAFAVHCENMSACGDCNYECLKDDTVCQNRTDYQLAVMDAICNSDLVYFIVPNFCGFPCASYFAFNERSVGYFNKDNILMEKYMSVRKRFIIISNSESANFTEAMQQQVFDEPDMLYLKSSKYGKKSVAGDIMDSDDAKDELKAFLDRFVL